MHMMKSIDSFAVSTWVFSFLECEPNKHSENTMWAYNDLPLDVWAWPSVSTAIGLWKHRIPSDLRSESKCRLVSTTVGDHAGILGAVVLLFWMSIGQGIHEVNTLLELYGYTLWYTLIKLYSIHELNYMVYILELGQYTLVEL